MKWFLWLCIRAELILLALALYWHHYIPQLVPYAKPQPSEGCCRVCPANYPLGTTNYVWNNLNDRSEHTLTFRSRQKPFDCVFYGKANETEFFYSRPDGSCHAEDTKP